MIKWDVDNMSKEELQRFNRLVEAGKIEIRPELDKWLVEASKQHGIFYLGSPTLQNKTNDFKKEISNRIQVLEMRKKELKEAYKKAFSYSKQIELLADIKALVLAIKELKRLVK